MDFNRTRRAVSFLVACVVASVSFALPSAAEQPISEDAASGLGQFVDARRTDRGVLFPALIENSVQLPSHAIDRLAIAARSVQWPLGTPEVGIVERASLSIRASSPDDDDDPRMAASYPAQLVRSTSSVSPLGPVVQPGTGDQHRERIDIPDSR